MRIARSSPTRSAAAALLAMLVGAATAPPARGADALQVEVERHGRVLQVRATLGADSSVPACLEPRPIPFAPDILLTMCPE